MINNQNKFNDHKVKLTNAMYDINDTNEELSKLSNIIEEIEKKREDLINNLDIWKKEEEDIEEKEKKDLFEVSEEAKKLYTFFGIKEDELPNIDYIQPTFRIINNITKYLTEEVSDGGYSNGPINIPIAWMPESITENFTKGISIADKKHLIPSSINIRSVYSLSPITPPTVFSNDSTSSFDEQSSIDANKYDPSEYITINQDIKSDETIISEISEITDSKKGDDETETVALYDGIKKQSYENAMNRSAGIPRAYENGPAYFLKRCSKSLFNNMDDFEKEPAQNAVQFQSNKGEKPAFTFNAASGKFWQLIDNMKTEEDIQNAVKDMQNVKNYNESKLSPKDFVKTYRDNSTELRDFRVKQIKYMLKEAISRIEDTRNKLSIGKSLQDKYKKSIEDGVIYEVDEDVKIFTDTSFYESGNDQKNSNDYCVTQENDSDVMKIIDELGFNNKVVENKIKETIESEEFQKKLNQKIIDNKDDQLKFILDLHKAFRERLINIIFSTNENGEYKINQTYYDQVNKRLKLAANLRRIDKIINYIPLIRIEQDKKNNIIPDLDYYTSLIRPSLNYEEYINIIDDDGNEITIEVIDHDTKLNNFRNKIRVLKDDTTNQNDFIINLNIPKIKKDIESLANDIKIFKKIYDLSEADINNDKKIKPMINTLKKKYRNNVKLENISREICKKKDETNKKTIDRYLVSLILHPDHFNFLKYFYLNDFKIKHQKIQKKSLTAEVADINEPKDYQVSFAEKILEKFTIKGHEIKFDISDCDQDLKFQFYYNYIIELIYELNDELQNPINTESLKNNLFRFFLYNYVITQHVLTGDNTKGRSVEKEYLGYDKLGGIADYTKNSSPNLQITRKEEGLNKGNFWKKNLLPGLIEEYKKYAFNLSKKIKVFFQSYYDDSGNIIEDKRDTYKKSLKNIFEEVIKKIFEFIPDTNNVKKISQNDKFFALKESLANLTLDKSNFSIVCGYIHASFRSIQYEIEKHLKLPKHEFIDDIITNSKRNTKKQSYDNTKNKTYIDLSNSKLTSQR